MWTTGLLLVGGGPGEEVSSEKLEFLRAMMLQNTGKVGRRLTLSRNQFEPIYLESGHSPGTGLLLDPTRRAPRGNE